ncbi:MAG: hypothetical protein P1P76_06820 [Anaerolineales bacterium]|nr:hypothetical protein [Anaerolineales bacterium]
MTIDQTVGWIAAVLLVGFAFALVLGMFQFRSARKLPYFLLRKERMTQGWRMIFLALIMGLTGGATLLFGREAAYVIVPPTPSVTPSPTITNTPTITLTPTITNTPLASDTPTATPTSTETPTPQLPSEIQVLFRETQTPQPDAVFSTLLIARRLDNQNQAINPQEDFVGVSGRLYAAFTYNNLQDGVRWTAVWRQGDAIICIETQPWDGGTGGYGYTECETDLWSPGEYEVQIFYGEEWMVSSRFEVLGDGDATATDRPAGS